MAVQGLDGLIAAARQEPTLVGVGLTDAQSMRSIIWPAFQREAAPWAELEYAHDVVPPRVLARLKDTAPGASRPDIVIVGNPTSFARAGLTEPFDQPAAGLYPAGWTDAQQYWIPVYVQPVVLIYNQYHAAPPPARWTDLADARWAGRVVFEEPWRMISTGPALAELHSALGAEGARELLAQVAARQPLLVGDNERSVLEVATGDRWVGLSIWNVARRIRPGSPVRHVFLEPTPCVPGFAALARGGASPNLARLFLAWLASSGGQRAYAETGRIPALPDLDVPTALTRILPPGITPLFGSTDWLSEPERWVERFRQVFAPSSDTARAGKLG
jgi:ABC-type Fe3+ transport system substrate-binding protein